jgi:hypothetical protein
MKNLYTLGPNGKITAIMLGDNNSGVIVKVEADAIKPKAKQKIKFSLKMFFLVLLLCPFKPSHRLAKIRVNFIRRKWADFSIKEFFDGMFSVFILFPYAIVSYIYENISSILIVSAKHTPKVKSEVKVEPKTKMREGYSGIFDFIWDIFVESKLKGIAYLIVTFLQLSITHLSIALFYLVYFQINNSTLLEALFCMEALFFIAFIFSGVVLKILFSHLECQDDCQKDLMWCILFGYLISSLVIIPLDYFFIQNITISIVLDILIYLASMPIILYIKRKFF